MTAGGEATSFATGADMDVDRASSDEQAWEAEPQDWGGGDGADSSGESILLAQESGGRAGCASCTVGAERDAPHTVWLTLGVFGLFFWRRRR